MDGLSLKAKSKEQLDAIWEGRGSGIVLTVLAIAVAAILVCWIPVPGVSVAVMGVAAALLSLRTKATGAEKATWMLIISALLVVEVLAIRKDRADTYIAQLTELREERSHFADIGKGIESVVQQTQNQFDVTMGKSDKVIGLQSQALGGLSDNLKTLTGGHAYALLAYVPGQHFLEFIHSGKYPLYGVSAHIFQIDSAGHLPNLLGVTVPIGDMIRGHGNPSPVPAGIPSSGDAFNANIFFTARNGDWIQLLREVKTESGWVRAVRVQGRFTSLKKERTMCETIDPKFPRGANGKIDEFVSLSGPKPPPCQ